VSAALNPATNKAILPDLSKDLIRASPAFTPVLAVNAASQAAPPNKSAATLLIQEPPITIKFLPDTEEASVSLTVICPKLVAVAPEPVEPADIVA